MFAINIFRKVVALCRPTNTTDNSSLNPNLSQPDTTNLQPDNTVLQSAITAHQPILTDLQALFNDLQPRIPHRRTNMPFTIKVRTLTGKEVDIEIDNSSPVRIHPFPYADPLLTRIGLRDQGEG